MQKRLLAVCLLLALVACQNNRPIIGIFTQPSEYDQYPASTYSYIAASYIKYVEGAGAQAVPIPYDAPLEYLDQLFNKINGVLFPGGDVEFEDPNPTSQAHIFLKNAIYILQKAKNATDNGDFFPVWGTCLGFQLINFIESGLNSSVLYTTDSDTGAHPIENVDHSSKLFSQMPADLLNYAENYPSLYYHHSTYVPLAAYNHTKLSSNLKITSTCTNNKGYKFVNSFESYKYPIFGSQFHAEKNLYEWKINPPHDFKSCQVTQYFANFFVNQTRQNFHSFNGTADENKYLIYQYPSYDLSDSSFTQVYIIPNFNQTAKSNSTSFNPSKPQKEKFLF